MAHAAAARAHRRPAAAGLHARRGLPFGLPIAAARRPSVAAAAHVAAALRPAKAAAYSAGSAAGGRRE